MSPTVPSRLDLLVDLRVGIGWGIDVLVRLNVDPSLDPRVVGMMVELDLGFVARMRTVVGSGREMKGFVRYGPRGVGIGVGIEVWVGVGVGGESNKGWGIE